MQLVCRACNVQFRRVGSNNRFYCSQKCRSVHHTVPLREDVKPRTRRERGYNLQWYRDNKERVQKASRERTQRYRQEALALYGNACVCCGISYFEFLTFDHIGGGGCEERRTKFPNAHSFYKFLKDNYLPEKYRILCQNCNSATAYYGVCPHQRTLNA